MTEVLTFPEAVSSATKYEKLSTAYQLIDTKDVVNTMRDNGFVVTQTFNLKPRKRDPRVVKHLLRMRHRSLMETVNGSIPEIIVINSHDGSTTLRMECGIYRMVCANGLIIKSSTAYSSRIRHINVTPEIVMAESMKVIESARESARRTELFMNKIISPVEQKEFAMRAIEMRGMHVDVEQVLRPRRSEDAGNDLWRVFNRIQENIMKGGLEGLSESGRRIRTQGLNSMGPVFRTNVNLWAMAEQYL
jgi:hypothetical protein